MSLYVIATPIGPNEDLSTRARRLLAATPVVIGEDFKNTSRFLKQSGIKEQRIEILNEHSRERDFIELVELCRTQEVSLISDCGTPGFCDPGAELVKRCRQDGISVRGIPGPSCLMSFLSVTGHRIDQFLFRGFLPAEAGQRKQAIDAIKSSPCAVILMDTPYRLQKILSELNVAMPSARLVLGADLTTDEETVLEGTAQEILARLGKDKAEFVLMILPKQSQSSERRKKSK